MTLSEQALMSYAVQARARGWVLRAGSMEAGWQFTFRGKLLDYKVYLDIVEDWVYMQCPMLEIPARPECLLALYTYLLQANDHMYLAKFAITQDKNNRLAASQLTLIVDHSIDGFDATTFRWMIEAIEQYAEAHRPEIVKIALDPSVVQNAQNLSASQKVL